MKPSVVAVAAVIEHAPVELADRPRPTRLGQGRSSFFRGLLLGRLLYADRRRIGDGNVDDRVTFVLRLIVGATARVV